MPTKRHNVRNNIHNYGTAWVKPCAVAGPGHSVGGRPNQATPAFPASENHSGEDAVAASPKEGGDPSRTSQEKVQASMLSQDNLSETTTLYGEADNVQSKKLEESISSYDMCGEKPLNHAPNHGEASSKVQDSIPEHQNWPAC